MFLELSKSNRLWAQLTQSAKKMRSPKSLHGIKLTIEILYTTGINQEIGNANWNQLNSRSLNTVGIRLTTGT